MVNRAVDRVVVVVPARGGVPAVGAAETVAEGLDLVGDPDRLRVVVIGGRARDAVDHLAETGFAGVSVTVTEAGAFAPGRWAATLAETCRDAGYVLLPASADGRDLAPRLAVLLGRALIAGALSVRADRVVVPRASGRALAEVIPDGPIVATMQPGVRTVARVADAGRVDPDVLELADAVADAEVLEVLGPDAATMDLSEAPFILGAGAGLGTREVADEMAEVADALDASVGATRVVTDEGWVSHDRQIGTTGVVVDPRVYVAFGVSGAVQHTAGLGTPAFTVSVNTDAHCPMMDMADLAIVADAPAVIGELHRRLCPTGDDEET